MNKIQIEAGQFERLFLPAQALNSECALIFEENRLKLPVDDPANVASASITLDSSAFSKYSVEEDTFGVDIGEIKKSLKHISKHTEISIIYDEKDSTLELLGDNQQSSLRTLPESEVATEAQTPEIDYATEAILPGEEFNTAIKAADEFADYVSIRVEKEGGGITIEGKGDINTTERTISEEDVMEITTSPSHNTYSLDYLREIIKSVDDDTQLHMKMGKRDRPMRLKFSFNDGTGEVLFLIAPKVNSKN